MGGYISIVSSFPFHPSFNSWCQDAFMVDIEALVEEEGPSVAVLIIDHPKIYRRESPWDLLLIASTSRDD